MFLNGRNITFFTIGHYSKGKAAFRTCCLLGISNDNATFTGKNSHLSIDEPTVINIFWLQNYFFDESGDKQPDGNGTTSPRWFINIFIRL